ncbi:MAG: plasmid pRiA4b ORF-3 family protein [Methanosarcinaceae archaeon]
MKNKFNLVYQFKITLEDAKPPIWRRIQVPETYTLWDFHVAIQDVMNWLDYHLHRFEVINPSTGTKLKIGIPEEVFGECGVTPPGWNEKMSDYFTMENRKADYIYDFGDNWIHNIELEKIVTREEGVKYPICIKGKRASPPEDCGGVWGYEELLEIIVDPNHKRHEEMLNWTGGDFDPEYFDVKNVYFDNPNKRLKIAFE